MFYGLHDCLMPGGSVCILSEQREYYFASGTTEEWLIQNHTYDDFQHALSFMLAQHPKDIPSVLYTASLENTIELALEAKFRVTESKKYSKKDPLALENPWITAPGFMIKLTLD